MARSARAAPGGLVYHVLNRTAGRFVMFRRERDYAAFEEVVAEAVTRRVRMRILSYCLMPNHWHFVVWPREDGELSEFFRWVGVTHAMRWRVAHGTVGWGALYQGRYKSFPMETDRHLLTVCRYVERNALTAGLVDRAEEWRWGSLWSRAHEGEGLGALLTAWPVDGPTDWVSHVNAPVTGKELERFQLSVRRGRPFGSEGWVNRMAGQLQLGHTLRTRGRPRKAMAER